MTRIDALARYANAEFAWGRLDCCLFVADVLKDIHGVDYAKQWRGSYRSQRGALKLVAEYGGVGGLASAAFGPMKPPLLARRGDPVLFRGSLAPDGIDEALGVCDGAIVCLTDKGLMRVPMSAAVGCWHVGGDHV